MRIADHMSGDDTELQHAGRAPAAADRRGGHGASPWRHQQTLLNSLARVGVIVVVCAAWYVAVIVGFLDQQIVSSPAGVVQSFLDIITLRETYEAVAVTGIAIVEAFVLGLVCGVVLGYALGLSGRLHRAFYPLVVFILSTPKVVFLPLFLLLFGIGATTTVLFGAFHSVFYVIVPVVGGVGLVGDRERRVGLAFGASKLAMLIHLVIPASIRSIFAAAWIGLIQSFVGVLVVELFVSVNGVGTLLLKYERALAAGKVLAIGITLAVLCILAGQLINVIERKVCKWPA